MRIAIDRATMQVPDAVAKLCEVCSNLDTHLLTHHLHPCRNPLPCLDPPYKRRNGTYLALGSVNEIKSRRSTCDVCKLIAEALDQEPSDLAGTCRITENEKYGSFTLPHTIKARDPSITHFHLTQATVIFETSTSAQLFGPPLPWDVKEWDDRGTHYLLHFQMKARSYSEATDPAPSSTHMDSDVLETIGGRYVGTQSNAQLFKRWLHECECEHGDACIPSSRSRLRGDKQPALVVDVIQLCLAEPPSHCRYAALSYVWGTAPVFIHLLENTRDLRKPGFLHSLPIPATIRDAITLVRAIGERYLWVDSLCIIQNDLKMQQEEIMRMGSIYSRALFTIIAATGDHANSGLPGVEQGSREQAQKILKLANCELLTVIDIRRTQSGIDDTTWAQRAWTFQERVLSNRLLVFSERQVYWNCRSASHSEERALEVARNIGRLRLPFPQKHLADDLSWEPLQSVDYCNLYYEFLYGYRKRRLTYQTDILSAFNGVSEMLGAVQNDRFFWGLPESHFSFGLTWELQGHAKRNGVQVPVFNSDGSKDMIPIPSWSWAAWSGEDLVHLAVVSDDGEVRPVVQFHMVDKHHQLVRIEQQPWEDNLDNRARAPWQDIQFEDVKTPQPPFPHSSRMGQLRFWTSLANVRAVRRQWHLLSRNLEYDLCPPSDFRPSPNETRGTEEIVQQDFIVIAARGPKRLVLLAVEWKDGIAYRVGRKEVKQAEWMKIKNRQWRLITLG